RLPVCRWRAPGSPGPEGSQNRQAPPSLPPSPATPFQHFIKSTRHSGGSVWQDIAEVYGILPCKGGAPRGRRVSAAEHHVLSCSRGCPRLSTTLFQDPD